MHLPLAAFHLSSVELFGFVGPVITILLLGTIIVIALYFKHQRQRLWHETVRTAMEKGLPIPPEPDVDRYSWRRRRTPLRDVRVGVILLAISGGLYAGLVNKGLPNQSMTGVYVTGAIGIAMLINALLTAIFGSKSTETDSSRTP